MRRKKIAINAIAGFTLQGLMIIYGFVFPRLVMSVYGSSVNGMLQSISQFLSYIALLDAGVSAVIRAKFYKPLANEDTKKTQSILNSAKDFYRKIAVIFLVYSICVAVLLPFTFTNKFDYLFTFFLVIIIGASTFAEYFFGISYQVLLEADQRKYIVYLIQSIVVLLNTILSVVLINNGFSIHFVKLVTAGLFIARPIVVSTYCRHRYRFVSGYREKEPIENKWAGMGHHFAYFLHTHTDIVLLTFAKGPLTVSVYSVYNMVVTALRQVLTYLTGGIEAAFGNMLAKDEQETLRKGLDLYELLIFSCTVVAFSTAAVTILDFVSVYTKGIHDVNYIEPVAAILLIIAEAIYCIRKPYEALVMASGKLKETMKGAFVEAFLNICISLALVSKFSISGVAIGTMIAMGFRTIQYSLFVSDYIVKRRKMVFFNKLGLYLATGFIIYFLFRIVPFFTPSNYMQWAVKALVVCVSSIVIVGCFDLVFYRDDTILLCKMVSGLFRKKKDR